jgi:lysophospholipid acyltransferase 5
LKRYLDFVSGKFSEDGKAPPSVGAGLERLLIGLGYVGIYQIGNIYINNDYFLGPTFAASPLWWKFIMTGIGGRIMLYKYVSVWIVAEGSCTLAGISYNGKEPNGAYKWNGCENIHVPTFEKAYKFGHIIASFNKCTNAWVAHNVYKRLKFLNNRHISQFAALLFLAVWHGLHTGYYMCFFLEFIVMNVEKDLEVILPKNQTLARWHASTIGFWIDVIISKTLVTIFFGYCILSFSLLSMTRWMKVYGELYYSGHLIFGLWPLYGPFVKKLLVPPREKSAERKLSGQESPKPSTSKAANGLGEKKEI